MTQRPTEAEVRTEPAGRRLDAWVNCLVLGQAESLWIKRSFAAHAIPEPMNDTGDIVPHYSISWSAAGPLLESMPYGHGITDDTVYIQHIVEVQYDRTIPNDLCRAICVALLLAKMSQS